MSGPSSVTLAVQSLTRKLHRTSTLEEHVKKLEIGDPTAASMVEVLTEPEYKSNEKLHLLSDSEVLDRLNEFGYDMNTLTFPIVYQLLSACAARARDKRAYESSKLIRAELDKLKGQIHSQNPEISEAAKKRRQLVQEELRGLSEQQQKSLKEWSGICKKLQVSRNVGKIIETEQDFDALASMCEAWYEWLLCKERARTNLCIEVLNNTVDQVAANMIDLGMDKTDTQQYSKVVIADNTLLIQKRTAFASAEKAVMSYMKRLENSHNNAFTTHPSSSSAASMHAANSIPEVDMSSHDPFAESLDDGANLVESKTNHSGTSSTGANTNNNNDDEHKAMLSADCATLTTAQVAHVRYSQQETLRSCESYYLRHLPLGASVHVLGRTGVVIHVGLSHLGDGVWVGIRLTVPHDQEVPMVYSNGQILGLDIYNEIMGLLKCSPEQALFAPAHVVHLVGEGGRDRHRLRGSKYQNAANTIQKFFLSVRHKKQQALANAPPSETSSIYTNVDMIAKAVGAQWRDVPSLVSQFLSVPTTFSLLLRARLAYIWIITHMNYYWYHENHTVDAILQDGGSNAMGLCILYRELCVNLGIDCCIVRGVCRAVGSDPLVPIGTRSDNHAWCVVKVDRDRKGQATVNSDRFILVDPTLGLGTWRGLKFHRCPNVCYFDVDPDILSTSHYPLNIIAGKRPFPSFQKFSANPLHTITHLNTIPTTLQYGRYDVETAIIPTNTSVKYQTQILYPGPINQLPITTDKAYVCFALHTLKHIDIEGMLYSMDYGVSGDQSQPPSIKLLTRYTSLIHVECHESKLPTHKIAYVTVVFPKAGNYILDLYVKYPHFVCTNSEFLLYKIPIKASAGVLSGYRSPLDVFVGFGKPLQVASKYKLPKLVHPSMGYVDISAPILVELCEEHEEGSSTLSSSSSSSSPESDREIQDIVAAYGDDWYHVKKFTTTKGAYAERYLLPKPKQPNQKISIYRAYLPMGNSGKNNTTSDKKQDNEGGNDKLDYNLQIYVKYKDSTNYVPVYTIGEKKQTPNLILAPSGHGYTCGVKLLQLSITPCCVITSVQTSYPRCLFAQIIEGKHTSLPSTYTIAGKCTTRLIPLDINSMANTIVENPHNHASIKQEFHEHIKTALLQAAADPVSTNALIQSETYQNQQMPTPGTADNSSTLLWQIACDTNGGDATIILYTGMQANGVMTYVGAIPVTIPAKPIV